MGAKQSDVLAFRGEIKLTEKSLKCKGGALIGHFCFPSERVSPTPRASVQWRLDSGICGDWTHVGK